MWVYKHKATSWEIQIFPHVLRCTTSDHQSLASIILLSLLVLSHVLILKHCKRVKNTQQLLLEKHSLCSRGLCERLPSAHQWKIILNLNHRSHHHVRCMFLLNHTSTNVLSCWGGFTIFRSSCSYLF